MTDYIYKLRKYRIVIRDQTIYDEVKLMLSGIAQGGSEYQAQLDTDGIIYVQILDTFSERGKNDTKEWIDFHAIVNYKFVYVKTGEVLNSRKIDAYSRAFIEKEVSVQQALRTSKLSAVDFISQEISKDMSHAFILSAKVSGEKWLDLFYIDGGTNCGISENMTFNFVENLNNSAGTYEVIEGKAVVVEAFPDSSIIKVLEKPLRFPVSVSTTHLMENPYIKLHRKSFRISASFDGLNTPGFFIKSGYDDYTGVFCASFMQAGLKDYSVSINLGVDGGYLLDINGLLKSGISLGAACGYDFQNNSGKNFNPFTPESCDFYLFIPFCASLYLKINDNLSFVSEAAYRLNVYGDKKIFNHEPYVIRAGLELFY